MCNRKKGDHHVQSEVFHSESTDSDYPDDVSGYNSRRSNREGQRVFVDVSGARYWAEVDTSDAEILLLHLREIRQDL